MRLRSPDADQTQRAVIFNAANNAPAPAHRTPGAAALNITCVVSRPWSCLSRGVLSPTSRSLVGTTRASHDRILHASPELRFFCVKYGARRNVPMTLNRRLPQSDAPSLTLSQPAVPSPPPVLDPLHPQGVCAALPLEMHLVRCACPLEAKRCPLAARH